MTKLVVVGAGLVGGSFAKAVLAADPDSQVVAVDLPERCPELAASGVFSGVLGSWRDAAARDALLSCDLAVLALPVSGILRELPWALDYAPVVTDVGSTKREVEACVAGHPRRGRFVPGHPMSGGPEGGFDAAREDLFSGQAWALCGEHADLDALACVRELVTRVGAQVVECHAGAHDRAVALTSHLPQLLASALSAEARQLGSAAAVRGPAFARLIAASGGQVTMWRDVFATNADFVAAAARELAEQLLVVARGLDAEPPDLGPAVRLLERARTDRGG